MVKKDEADIKISLCGDILISKRLPLNSYSGFDELQKMLHQHECRFANLETTIHRREGYPEAFPGGGYAMADPNCLSDLQRIGFNLFSTANNHAMDYGHNGLLATVKYLTDSGIPFAGTGKNLADASKPAFFECSNGRVALVSVTSSFHDSYAAGPQNQDMSGRPGVSPLKHRAVYEVDEKNYQSLLSISDSIGINNYHNQAIKEGYLLNNDYFKFGSYEFKKGIENGVHTFPVEDDLQRTVRIIADAKYQSDIVVVSIHSHQFFGNDKRKPAEFIKIFAHHCIEAGADIVACHGPHILRGIEIYKSGIVFYGLGNFIFQHEEFDFLPEEFYRKYGKTRDTVTGIGEIMKVRSDNGKKGLTTSPDVWKSMLVSVFANSQAMEIKLYPLEILYMDRKGLKGLPILSDDKSIIEMVKDMSKVYSTNIEMSALGYGFIQVERS